MHVRQGGPVGISRSSASVRAVDEQEKGSGHRIFSLAYGKAVEVYFSIERIGQKQ